MPYITCSYCKNIVVNCGHSLTLATFLVVCQNCYNRGEFLPQTMARYSLIQRSVYEQQCTRKKEAQETYRQLQRQMATAQSGVYETIFNSPTKQLTIKFAQFKNNTHQEEELIRQDIKQAIDSIMRQTETAVRTLIASQVEGIMALLEQILDGNKEGERELAQRKQEVMEFIQSKKYITSSEEGGVALISAAKIREVNDFFNARINEFSEKKDRLTRLLQAGQDVLNEANTEQRLSL